MIFKSLSRKTTSFAQLFDYMNRENQPVGEGIAWNLSTFDYTDRNRILADFYQNTLFLRPRKNGNVLYHEILSLPRKTGDDLTTLHNAIHDMATYWLEARAFDQLAYGRVHLDSHHIHMHLMVSSNAIGDDRRTLSRSRFRQIEQDCERYIAQRYPELLLPILHQKTVPGQSRQLSQQEHIRQTLQTILEQEITHQTPSIRARIHNAGLQFHSRGEKSYSVSLPSGKRYRFAKLGLLDQLLNVLETETAIARRQRELQCHLERVMPSRNLDPDHEQPPGNPCQ